MGFGDDVTNTVGVGWRGRVISLDGRGQTSWGLKPTQLSIVNGSGAGLQDGVDLLVWDGRV